MHGANIVLVLFLIAAMAATVVALVRGIIAFLREQTDVVRGEGPGPTAEALKSNRMMQARVLFQAIAILLVVLILFLAGRT